MRFFFPDSQDMVDPSFDFEKETRAEFRVRQQDDVYAHEVFEQTPFDGLLVSMGIVESLGGTGTGRYTMAQRHRLRRVGAREFFRLTSGSDSAKGLEMMGDCGAFSYVQEEEPPFTTEEVVEQWFRPCGKAYHTQGPLLGRRNRQPLSGFHFGPDGVCSATFTSCIISGLASGKF